MSTANRVASPGAALLLLAIRRPVPVPVPPSSGPGRPAARITVARISVARITVARISVARITVARITVARITVARITAAWARVVLAVSGEFCFVVWGVARIRDVGAANAVAAVLGAAFPVGMALGRLLAPRFAGHPAVVPAGALTAMIGTGLGSLGGDPWTVTAGLGVAGLGIAVLYPVTLAQLVATPGMAAQHSAPLGALASGTAILAAPALLAALSGVASLRIAFLLPIPLLALLVALPVPARRLTLGGPAS